MGAEGGSHSYSQSLEPAKQGVSPGPGGHLGGYGVHRCMRCADAAAPHGVGDFHPEVVLRRCAGEGQR